MTKKSKHKLPEQDYRYFFDNASDAIWVHDTVGIIVYANKAVQTLTGYIHAKLIGMNVVELFSSPRCLEYDLELEHKLLEGQHVKQPYEQHLKRKDGSEAILKIATSLVIQDDEVKGFQHIARDITEERKQQDNMRFYVQEIIKAQEDERKRIARELHDEVAPQLLLLIQRIDAITSNNRHKLSDYLKDKLEGLRCQTVEGLESLRRIAQDLRPRILDDLGLIPSIEWMADNLIMNHGIDAKVLISGKKTDLPSEVQLLLFRIAQEAINNVRRHARALLVVIGLDFEKDKTILTIRDNGIGFELPDKISQMPANGKLGLAGIQERAQLLSGTIDVRSEPGRGSTITVEIPNAKIKEQSALKQKNLELLFGSARHS
jgi:two-component system sensor histidine kinase DegS